MKLPNADSAIIAPEKLRDYLLSPAHPEGRHKATFFARLGYTQVDWQVLERDIRSQHLGQNAVEVKPTRYGRKFVITALLRGPAGTGAVTSVWTIEAGEESPRFLTAYPGRIR